MDPAQNSAPRTLHTVPNPPAVQSRLSSALLAFPYVRLHVCVCVCVVPHQIHPAVQDVSN